MRKRPRTKALVVLLLPLASLFILALSSGAQVQERFPKPDFESGYIRPDLLTPAPRATALEYADIAVLIAALSLATYFAHKQRSRRSLFLLMVLSLAYFGFFRKGCVCSIGAIQNVALSFFTPSYAVPVSVIVFFLLPLAFTLFFGRTFCAAVCPLGAVQDAVILSPVKVPGGLEKALQFIPYIYLSLAVLFAATGAGFIICQYDPFIGFFRFGADFNMVLLGVFILLLGTVVARPYCRFLCPYSVILNWLSRLSKWHVSITPNDCNNCRLCEEACPFGSIKKADETPLPPPKATEIKKMAAALLLLPVIVFSGGWIGSRLNVPLSRVHATVRLAEEILLENSGRRTEMTDETKAFRASGKPAEELFAEAGAIRNRMKAGGWIIGGFLGFIFSLRLIGLLIRRRNPEYDVDKGTCLSCGRCFAYCPYEQVRLGLMTPEELEALDKRDFPAKQFRA